jgi:nucleoside-triphosphatase
MKLLLTGPPGVGKTTLIQKVISQAERAFWVVCTEVRNEQGQRVGFEAETSTGLKGLIAHKHNISSDAMIGDYRVDPAAIDHLFAQPIKAAQANQFLIIDEIGRMQMLSSAFSSVIHGLFESEANFIATIRYVDEWTKEFTNRLDVITIVLTPENRAEAEVALIAIVNAGANLDMLSSGQYQAAEHMARQYVQDGQLLQLKKLYKNAITYVAQKRISSGDSDKYHVIGDHHSHVVAKQSGTWSCDCDLFNGLNQFKGRSGECSHIQAARLIQQL